MKKVLVLCGVMLGLFAVVISDSTAQLAFNENVRDGQGHYLIPVGNAVEHIDGEIDGEWRDANIITELDILNVEDQASVYTTRLYLKHDGQNLYIALLSTMRSKPGLAFAVLFDSDGDGSVVTDFDDQLRIPTSEFVANFSVPTAIDGFAFNTDGFFFDRAIDEVLHITAKGSETIDGRDVVYAVEAVHPLASGDSADIFWQVGNRVKLAIALVIHSGATTLPAVVHPCCNLEAVEQTYVISRERL